MKTENYENYHNHEKILKNLKIKF